MRADGTPVAHGEAVTELIQAMQLPTSLAIVKCAAHKSNKSPIAVGNNLADEAPKEATGTKQYRDQCCLRKIVLPLQVWLH